MSPEASVWPGVTVTTFLRARTHLQTSQPVRVEIATINRAPPAPMTIRISGDAVCTTLAVVVFEDSGPQPPSLVLAGRL